MTYHVSPIFRSYSNREFDYIQLISRDRTFLISLISITFYVKILIGIISLILICSFNVVNMFAHSLRSRKKCSQDNLVKKLCDKRICTFIDSFPLKKKYLLKFSIFF